MLHHLPFRSLRSKLFFCFCLLAVCGGELSGSRAWLRPALSASRAATLCVNPSGANGCFNTISAAVAAAVAGDTINVAAGTYNEQINLSKAGLILRGAKAGQTACTRDGAGESIINHLNGPVAINADNITIDGFTLQGATSQLQAGIHINASLSGHNIRNNLIQNNVIGVNLNSTGPATTLVQDNSFKNNNNPGAGNGTAIYSDNGLKNVNINRNCFSGHNNASMALAGGLGTQSNIQITNNTAVGEQLLELLSAVGVVISGNRAENAPASAGVANPPEPGAVISIGGGNDGVVIEGNTLRNNNVPAIHVRDIENRGPNANVMVRCNRIVGNSAADNLVDGLRVQAGRYTGTLNAENNWWGCNAGPGGQGCDTATSGVDFNPWLVMGLTAPSTAIKDAPNQISVSLNRNSAGAQAPCGVPDGTPVALQSSCGTFNLPVTVTINGVANATLTPTSLGTCNITATVDNQAQTASFTVTDGPVVTISQPAACLGPGDNLTVSVRLTNTATTAQNASFNVALPPQLRALPNCFAPVGSCNVPDAATINYNATLPAGQSVEVRFLVTVRDNVLANEEFNLTVNANLGGRASSITNRLKVTCNPIGPGQPPSPFFSGGTQQPGSLLVYNVYTSSAATPNTQNTRLSLTNTSTTEKVSVHLFFVSKECQVADAFVCLTAQQTTSFLASDLDPGTTGYVLAVAVDPQTGCPIRFNHLIGDSYLKFSTGQQANFGAEAITALSDFVASCLPNVATAEIRFDGVHYGALPAVIAVDNAASRLDNNQTLWFINRLDGNLATGTFAPATLTGGFFDDNAKDKQAEALATNIGNYLIGCQLSGPLLANRFPNGQRFETVVTAGRTGWVKLWLLGNGAPGLLGAMLNYNPNVRLASSAYNQGHLLHKLTTTSTTVLTIPVAPPNC